LFVIYHYVIKKLEEEDEISGEGGVAAHPSTPE
jgi:hypothetical protein